MAIKKHCPNCGGKIEEDSLFCSECGNKLENIGFFDKLNKKTNFPLLIFSFIVLGVFLFIGSIIWGVTLSNGSISFQIYIILTVIFSVFFGGLFLGYFGCSEQKDVIYNFSLYFGSLMAILFFFFGLIFMAFMGVSATLSSMFNPYSAMSYSSSEPSYTAPNMDILVFLVFLVPLFAYMGVFAGYILKENISGQYV